MTDGKERKPFLLRTPKSLRMEAVLAAQQEGISLNQFINLALAEKLVRLQHTQVEGHDRSLDLVTAGKPKLS